VRLISTASLLEASIVANGRGGGVVDAELRELVRQIGAEPVAFDMNQLDWARQAIRLYGEGRHPAALNFGDCFSYALSKATGEPLLFVGDDFSQTDVAAVDWRTG